MNVIKQIVKDGQYGTQTIRMIVKSAERGAQGVQGAKGDAATVSAGKAYALDPNAEPVVMNSGTSSDAVFDFYIPKGQKGDDGAIHYTAGAGISISEDNVITATGESVATWGDVVGNIENQTDLIEKFDDVADAIGTKQDILTAGEHIDITSNSISAEWPAVFTPAEWSNLWG